MSVRPEEEREGDGGRATTGTSACAPRHAQRPRGGNRGRQGKAERENGERRGEGGPRAGCHLGPAAAPALGGCMEAGGAGWAAGTRARGAASLSFPPPKADRGAGLAPRRPEHRAEGGSERAASPALHPAASPQAGGGGGFRRSVPALRSRRSVRSRWGRGGKSRPGRRTAALGRQDRASARPLTEANGAARGKG